MVRLQQLPKQHRNAVVQPDDDDVSSASESLHLPPIHDPRRKTIKELREILKERGVSVPSRARKDALVQMVLDFSKPSVPQTANYTTSNSNEPNTPDETDLHDLSDRMDRTQLSDTPFRLREGSPPFTTLSGELPRPSTPGAKKNSGPSVDPQNMTVKTLRQALKERGIPFSLTSRKAQLVELYRSATEVDEETGGSTGSD